jgi:hypothetical protein
MANTIRFPLEAVLFTFPQKSGPIAPSSVPMDPFQIIAAKHDEVRLLSPFLAKRG